MKQRLKRFKNMVQDHFGNFRRHIRLQWGNWNNVTLFYETKLPFSMQSTISFLNQCGSVFFWKLFRVYISMETRSSSLNTSVINYKVEPHNFFGVLCIRLFASTILKRLHQHSRKLILFLNLNMGEKIIDTFGFDHLKDAPLFKRYPLLAIHSKKPFFSALPGKSLFFSKNTNRDLFRKRRVVLLPVEFVPEEMLTWFPAPFHYLNDEISYLEIGLNAGYPESSSMLFEKGHERYISIQMFAPVYLIADDFTLTGYSCIYDLKIPVFPWPWEFLFLNKTASWNVESDHIRLTIGDHFRRLKAGIGFFPFRSFSIKDQLPGFLKSPRFVTHLDRDTYDLNIIHQEVEFPVNRITMLQVENHTGRDFYSWLSRQLGLTISVSNKHVHLVSYLDVRKLSEKKVDLIRFQYRKSAAKTGIRNIA